MSSGLMALPGYLKTGVDIGSGRHIESALGRSVNRVANEDREWFWLPPECCIRCNEMLHSDMCTTRCQI
jgi:hypothetical protein